MDEVEHFIGELASKNFPARRRAAEMLGEFGDERGVKPLIGILGDNSWQVRNTVVSSLVKIRDKNSIQPLVDCLRDEDPAVRNSAMSIMNEMGENVVEPLMNLLLNDDLEDVRIFSANTLGHTCNREDLQGMITGLHDSDENVRYAVAEALGRLGFQEAVMPLIEAMKKEGKWSKFSFITALGAIRDERACPALLEMLNDDVLSYPAIEALGEIGDVNGLFPILEVLEKSVDSTVLKACVISLSNIEATAAEQAKVERQGYFHARVLELFKELESPKLVDILIEIMQSDDINEVESAIRMLRYVKGEIPLESIFRLLTDERVEEDIRDILIRQGEEVIPSVINLMGTMEKDIQSNLIRVMGVLGTEDDAETLEEFLDLLQPEIVCDALKALGMLNAVNYFDRMASFLDSDDEEIRNAAVGGLTLLNKRGLMTKVEVLAKSNNHFVRRGGYRVLGFIASKEAINCLMEGLTDESGIVRAAVVQSIGYAGIRNKNIIENDDYFDSISTLLLDEDISVRVETIIAMGRINHPRSYDNLIRMLDSDESEVRRFAIRAVGRCGIAAAVPKLCGAFESETNIELRIFICIALGQCGAQEAVPVLLEAIDDKAPELVEEVINSLRLIGSENIIDEILPYLESESWIVRAAVLNAVSDLQAVSALPVLLGFIEKIRGDEKENLLLRIAIRALGKIGGLEESDLLISFLTDSSCCYEAFGALSAIWYRHDGVYDLKKIENHIARRLACSVYGFIEKISSESELKGCLDDPYPSVRRAAALALRQLKTPMAEEFQDKLRKSDSDFWVKKIINHD